MLNDEKIWYGFHSERGKESIVGEHWMYKLWVVFESASAVKSLTSFLTSFLRYHKYIPNFPR